MIGYYKVSVVEDDKIVQSVEGKNAITISAIDGLLNRLFSTSLYSPSPYLGWSITFDGLDALQYYGDIAGTYAYGGMEMVKCSTNAIQIQDGPFNKSAYFDGSTGYYISNFDYSATATTVECWVKISSNIVGTIIQTGITNTSSMYGKNRLCIDTGVPGIVCMQGSSSGSNDVLLSALGAISLNEWHHIAAVRSNSNGSLLFVDGVLAGIHAYPLSNVTATTYPGCLIGWGKTSSAVPPTWASQIQIFTGNIANLALYPYEGIYTGSVVGTRYFNPGKNPLSMGNSLGRFVSSSSSFRPMLFALSKDTTASRYEGTLLDDCAFCGIQNDPTAYVIDLTANVPYYTVSITRESTTSVKVTITIKEDFATGEWKSLLMLDYVHRPYGNLTTYPKVSKIVFPQPISKRNRSLLVIEWTLSLSN
jgi:hypothetical protein